MFSHCEVSMCVLGRAIRVRRQGKRGWLHCTVVLIPDAHCATLMVEQININRQVSSSKKQKNVYFWSSAQVKNLETQI